jgi:hypothetical protein
MKFGPGRGKATLAATFTCTRPVVGGTFLLSVDLTWSGQVSTAQRRAIAPGGSTFRFVPASVAGTPSRRYYRVHHAGDAGGAHSLDVDVCRSPALEEPRVALRETRDRVTAR